jgi:hypothetical protein
MGDQALDLGPTFTASNFCWYFHYPDMFCTASSSLQYFELGHERFLPFSFQKIYHWHLTLCILSY